MSKPIGKSPASPEKSTPTTSTNQQLTTKTPSSPKLTSKSKKEIVITPDGRRFRGSLELDWEKENDSDEEKQANSWSDQARKMTNAQNENRDKKENDNSSNIAMPRDARTKNAQFEKPANSRVANESNDPRDDYSRLTVAIREGDLDLVKQLIEQNPDVVHSVSGTEPSLLVQALKHGKLSIAQALVSANPPLDHQSQSGETALMVAIDSDFTDLAKILIDKGANIHLTDSSGSTALMYATRKNHAEIAGMLIKNNAAIELKGDYGDTELARIITSGHTEFANQTQKNDSNVDMKINYYRSAFFKALTSNHFDLANLFIDKIGQFNLQDPLDNHWLQLLVRNGNSKGVRIILEKSLKIPNTLPVSGKPVEEFAAPLYANMAMQNLFFEALRTKDDEISSLLIEHAAKSDILSLDKLTKKAFQFLRNSKIEKEANTKNNSLRHKMFEIGSLIPSTFQSGVVDTLSKYASAYTAASLDPAELTDAQLEMIFFQSIASSNELHSESEKISEQMSIKYAHMPLKEAWLTKLLIRTAQFKADQRDQILSQFINNMNSSVTTQQLRDAARNAGWHPMVIKFLTDIWTSLARRRSKDNFFATIKTRLSSGEWSRKIMALDSDEARHIITLQLDTLNRWVKA